MPLPAELVDVQPYSMCPLMRRTGHADRYASKPAGALRGIDDPELSIRIALFAPMAVQREAQAAGYKGIIMVRPKGLDEAMERARADAEKG